MIHHVQLAGPAGSEEVLREFSDAAGPEHPATSCAYRDPVGRRVRNA